MLVKGESGCDHQPFHHDAADAIGETPAFVLVGGEYLPVHRDPATGSWHIADPPGLWPLYHLPELASATRVFVAEGEKCADLAVNLGVTATTTAHGKLSAHLTDLTPLAGREVIILPDVGGDAYAEALVGLLAALNPRPTVKVVRLPGLAENGADIEQWLQIVPDAWEPEQCRAELERLADAAPAINLDEAAEEEDDWPPLRLGTLPTVEAFPLYILPGPARDLAKAAATSIGCPVDFPAVATLAAASGAIGRSTTLRLKPGYFETASLYVGLVGGPSSGKSPALCAALAPIWAISHTLYEEWQSAVESRNAAPKDEKGDVPVLRRIVTSDPTTEALGPILAENPRGATVAPDEMTKWVLGMDQYKGGKGGDRPFYMSAWGGESILIDRAKHMKAPIAVPHPFLTVAGGLTPDMLSSLPEGAAARMDSCPGCCWSIPIVCRRGR